MITIKPGYAASVPERRCKELARKMREAWKYHAPSSCSTATSMVYGMGFMAIEKPSPLLKSGLAGKRLLDLGAGDSVSYIPMAHFAAVLSASEYVAIDRYNDYRLAEETMHSFIGGRYPGTKFKAVNEDMLVYLSE